MFLHELQPAPGSHKTKRRVGRGHGSGRGSTAGRGNKGQNSRAGGRVNPRFEGGQLPMVLRLPRKRGFTNRNRIEYAEVNLGMLKGFPAASEVTLEALQAARLVRDNFPVKVLGHGQLDRALTVHAHKFSASAKEKIEAAGGQAIMIGAEEVKPEEA
ncbi:MAG: 50S ribosomal protein L15 [Chloroflexota bacterium]